MTYEEVYKNFKWCVPEHYNFAFDVVDEWAKADDKKIAIVSVGPDNKTAERQTFYELSLLSNKFANLLLDLGFKKGDRALLIVENIPEWHVAILGMTKVGMVIIPGATQLTSKDIEYRLKRSGAVLVITDNHHADLIDAIETASQCHCEDPEPVEGDEAIQWIATPLGKLGARDDKVELRIKCKMIVRENRDGWLNFNSEVEKRSSNLDLSKTEKTRFDDPYYIFFTSGTTGNPKMVLHTYAYPLGHEVTARFAQDLKPTDLHWTVSSTGWAKAAWGKLFGQMIVGSAILQREICGKFDPQGMIECLERFGVTTFCAPPTVYRMLVQLDLKKYKLCLRHCMSAGEPLNPEVIRIWKDAYNLDIHDFFGQTETVCLLSNYSFMPIKYGSIGRPTPGHDVRIVDDDGMELNTGEEGNIAVNLSGAIRPPGLFKEYWDDPDENKKAFRGNYYYTGDRGYRDEDGYFWFIGRGDDVIKSSGYRIGPFEVESALLEHPAVVESAVIGVEDPQGVRGIIVKAFVVLAKGYNPSAELTKELQEHVKGVTAPYKYPRIIQYIDSLPKTVSGKILRRELRKL